MSKRRNQLIQEIISIEREKTGGFVEQINSKVSILSVLLADEGWYMSSDSVISTLSKLYIHQIQEDSGILDYYMVEEYKKQFESIVILFEKKYSNRFKILKKAFNAHKNKDYELSIPVFLTQIEGIFYDLTEKNIFSKGRGKKKDNTAKYWIEELDYKTIDFKLAMLESIKNNENIATNFKDSTDYPKALNRNKILHGRDLNFSSEINSFKAISLLVFIGTTQQYPILKVKFDRIKTAHNNAYSQLRQNT